MCKPDIIAEIRTVIKPDDFYQPQAQLVYKALLEMNDNRQVIDLVTVVDQLNKSGDLDRVGGIPYVTYLCNQVPSAANAMAYAKIVLEDSKRRQLAKIGRELTAKALDVTQELTVADIQSRISQVITTNQDTDLPTAKEACIDYFDWLSDRAMKEGNGILTGLKSIDSMTGGLDVGDLVIIAARPSMGKTAFAGQIIVDAAAKQNKGVLFYSMEMSRNQILSRMVSMLTGIDSRRLLRPKELTEQEYNSVIVANEKISKWNLTINERKRRTPEQISADARYIQATRGLDLIVIDYLQLMTDGKKHGGDNRVQEIANISSGLKNIAGELKVPVIALSQLSRAVEARNDKRPMLSDLRDSGSIEQDADKVFMLYRDKYYNRDNEQDITEVSLRKNRNGGTGTAELMFIPQLTKFIELLPEGYCGTPISDKSVPA